MESEGTYVSVCPHTNITFTCTAFGVTALSWFALPLLNEDTTLAVSTGSNVGVPVVIEDVFTITLVEVETVNIMNGAANLTSTLNVVIGDVIDDVTNVTCKTVTGVASLMILKKGGCVLHPYMYITQMHYIKRFSRSTYL